MTLKKKLLYFTLLIHSALIVLSSNDDRRVKSTAENATTLLDITTLEDNCEDNVCRNFYYPNVTEVAFFDLKPIIKIVDGGTYNIRNPFEMDNLIFQNSTFAHFPLQLFFSITMRELDMRNCSIETITWENFLMSGNLQILLLSSNKITSITEMTFNYASDLEFLFLDSNRIEILVSESFKGLSHLRYLDLSNNNLKELPGTVFAYTIELNELNLSNNHLRYLPNELFSRNHQLKIVHLRNNHLRTFDEYIFRNQAILTIVDISNNIYLSTLIINIQTQYLIAANCSLYLVNLYGHVKYVDLRDNQIVELYFAQPESLEKLVLRNNALQQIASLERAINLHELILADNPELQYIIDPWEIKTLERLDMSNTSLKHLPISNLAEQQNLQVLNISNNKIQDINPANFKYLENLTHFYIDSNDWNCYNLRLVMDLLIQPNSISYNHDRFDPDFPGEYIKGIACMYRLEEEGVGGVGEEDSNESEDISNQFFQTKQSMMFSEQLKLQMNDSYESTNQYPTNGITENQLLKREIESLRKELKAIVSFYESKFDGVFKKLNDLNNRIGKFEAMNETLFQHITLVT